MTSSLPYLPTEITDIIFAYKDAMEEKDRRNAVNAEFKWRWYYIKHRLYKDEDGYALDINDYTACRRCHCIDASTLGKEWPGSGVDGNEWSILRCQGCLTPKEETEDREMYRNFSNRPEWCDCDEEDLFWPHLQNKHTATHLG